MVRGSSARMEFFNELATEIVPRHAAPSKRYSADRGTGWPLWNATNCDREDDKDDREDMSNAAHDLMASRWTNGQRKVGEHK